MNKYKINPVKAVCAKYAGRDHGIQGENDTCFGICAAFSGTEDTYAMDPKCTEACTNLIEKRKIEIFGVGSCDHQVPYRPVFWGQTPRYVPKFLREGATPEMAKNMCLKACESANMVVEECQENCIVDYNAIEQGSNEGVHLRSLENFLPTSGRIRGTDSLPGGSGGNYTAYIAMGVLLGAILLFFMFFIYMRKRY